MISVVLVPSPVIYEIEDSNMWRSYVPLGLVSIATILNIDGYKVDIIDTKQLVSFSIDEAAKYILDKKPTIVGFSTMCNSYITTVKLARACKMACPNLIVVFGGPQATIVGNATLEAFRFIDYVVNGESEQTISSLIKIIGEGRHPENIPGISFRQGEKILQNPPPPDMVDFNKTPTPSYRLYPGLQHLDTLPLEVGRGCPFECSFCSTSYFWHRKYRLRSTDSLVKKIKELSECYSIQNFSFQHDNLTALRKHVIEMCTAIQNAGLNINWTCSSRIDSLDSELIKKLASAGCKHIYMGIESGSPRIQKMIRKNLHLEHAVETARLILEAKMDFTASFMMGFPEETMSDLLKTVDLMFSLKYIGTGNRLIQLHLLAPAPGTLLYHNNQTSLRFDGHFSDFAIPKLFSDDVDLIIKHPDIFSAYYYYDTANIKRNKLLRLHYFLFMTLNVLPYTAYILWKDERFRFPILFFERIDNLHLDVSKQFDFISSVEVAHFITDILDETELVGHFVQDVLAYEITANELSFSAETNSQIVHRFKYNVEELINQIKNRDITIIPEKLERDDHCMLFIKKDSQLSTSRLNAELANLF